MNNTLYNPFDAMRFGPDECFLCGALLEGNRSDEHIFPEWLLHRYNLWNKHLFLLNGTSIPYSKLTIPCCIGCNTGCLSRLENIVKQHIENGYNNFVTLDRKILYQWLLKIWYGLLFKEQLLRLDRTNPESRMIMPVDVLEQFRNSHFFLQSIRQQFQFESFQPWSIFIFPTHAYGDDRDFDYHDGIFTLTFSIRMGDVGIVACLEDNGTQESALSSYFSLFQKHPLHWIQFSEIAARIAYKASLLNRTPHYVSITGENQNDFVHVTSLPLQGFINKPIYDEWINEDYAKLLLYYWRGMNLTIEDILTQDGLQLTFLFNDDDSVKHMDRDGNVIE